MENNQFGQLLKKLREEKGFSITTLSKRSGVSQPYISQLENGKRNPSPEILKKLAPSFEMNLLAFRIATGLTTLEKENERLGRKYELLKSIDLLALLESNSPITYKGNEISNTDRKRITDILEALFMED